MSNYQELKGHRDLKVYQLAYKLAMDIFIESKAFPKDERYSLPIKSAAPHAVSLQISHKVFVNANTQRCSSANWQMQTAKQLKLKSG